MKAGGILLIVLGAIVVASLLVIVLAANFAGDEAAEVDEMTRLWKQEGR